MALSLYFYLFVDNSFKIINLKKKHSVSCTYPSDNKTSMRRRNDMSLYVPATSQVRYISNETPNNVSVERRQDVSVVCIHDVPLVRFCDVSCNSQMKHPTTSLWYVSTTSRSYVVTTPYPVYCLYYVFQITLS